MKKMVVVLSMVLMSTGAWAADTALYTHCVRNWSAETVGEVLLQRAVEDGFPVVAPEGERSGTKAYQLGVGYFRWLDPEPSETSAVLCSLLVEHGPAGLAGW